jgi:hypothetical protein
VKKDGFWNSAGRTAMNILSLGATKKFESIQNTLEEAERRYRTSFELLEQLKARMDRIAGSRGRANRDAHACLQEVITVLEVFGNVRGFESHTSSDQDCPALEKMQKTVTDFNVVLELIAGSGAGVATTAGAWAIVSALGVASTGTAISGLSGAAASHAALAWFGGGSLATGIRFCGGWGAVRVTDDRAHGLACASRSREEDSRNRATY